MGRGLTPATPPPGESPGPRAGGPPPAALPTETLLLRTLLLVLALGCGTAPDGTVAADPAPPAGDGTPDDPDPAALAERHRALRAQLRALVGDLERAGRYDCCIETPCATCALRMGGCKCGEGLRRGEPVCEECAMMWRSGQGAEAGVDPDSVRSFLEAQREMEARARSASAASEPASDGGGVAGGPPPPAPGSTGSDDAALVLEKPAEPAGCACPGHAGLPAATAPAATAPAATAPAGNASAVPTTAPPGGG